jgi:hypothetical protein
VKAFVVLVNVANICGFKLILLALGLFSQCIVLVCWPTPLALVHRPADALTFTCYQPLGIAVDKIKTNLFFCCHIDWPQLYDSGSDPAIRIV